MFLQKTKMHNRLFLSVSYLFEEALLISHLTFDLIWEMGSRLLWVWMTIRFIIYVSLLVPGFWRTAFIFLISDYIKKSVRYGNNPRNFLDIYTPVGKHSNCFKNSEEENKHPVVIFISGGAWIIGYKAWCCFMGLLLSQLGIVFVSPDYRNFPQGTISDMTEDVSTAIEWTLENIHLYGGNASYTYLIGQSAGAHVCALSLLNQAYQVARNKAKSCPELGNTNNLHNIKHNLYDDNHNRQFKKWKPEDFKGFIGVAGAYNLVELKEYFNRKGLYADVLLHIMENDFYKHSPLYRLYLNFVPNHESPFKPKPLQNVDFDPHLPYISLVQLKHEETNKNFCSSLRNNKFYYSMFNVDQIDMSSYLKKKKRSKDITKRSEITTNPFLKYPLVLCPMYLFHGGSDQTVPVDGTTTFAKHLATFNVETYLKIYPSKTHTGPIIEDPMEGQDPLVCDILRVIFPNQSLEETVRRIEKVIRGNLKIPKCIISLARRVCPF